MRKKRLGRGHGSGMVKTSGRGTKGQKARGTIRPVFEGGQLSQTKRTPFLRGKQRNKSRHVKPHTISLDQMLRVPSGTKVNVDYLVKAGILHVGEKAKIVSGVKKFLVVLHVTLPVSSGAKTMIEKAGGTVKTMST
jgi:large subunit ribosomal protein L15